MAKRIKAINALRPRLKRLPPIDEHLLAEYSADRSSLSKADVTHALLEISAAIEDFAAMGRSVRLTGIGLITPGMNTKGELTIRSRPDPRLVRALNAPKRFVGKVINARNLRKSGAELVVQLLPAALPFPIAKRNRRALATDLQYGHEKRRIRRL